MGGKGTLAGKAIKLALAREPMILKSTDLGKGDGLLRGE